MCLDMVRTHAAGQAREVLASYNTRSFILIYKMFSWYHIPCGRSNEIFPLKRIIRTTTLLLLLYCLTLAITKQCRSQTSRDWGWDHGTAGKKRKIIFHGSFGPIQ